MGWFQELVIVGGGAVCGKMIHILKNGAGELAGVTARIVYGLCGIVGIWGALTGGPKTPPKLPPTPPEQAPPRGHKKATPGPKRPGQGHQGGPRRQGGARQGGARQGGARQGGARQPGFISSLPSRVRFRQIISSNNIIDDIDDIIDV
jgi:hypothetical protein